MIQILSRMAHAFKHSNAASESTDDDTKLREFIYLDEVSLTSFIAARGGAIADEIKASNQSLIEGGAQGTIEHEAGIGSALIGSAKGSFGASANLKSSSTQGIETTFKLVAQSRFKDFLEDIKRDLISSDKLEPLVNNELRIGKNAILATHGLRGRLFELHITPRPSQLFSMSLVMDEIMKMANETPGKLEQLIPALNSQQTLLGISMLRRLYSDLIPLEALVNGMSVLSKGQTDYIIKTPERLDCSQVGDTYSELRITTLANQSNFWTDIRRALYTGRDFRVLVRAIGDSTETDPRSLPLLDVMKSINGDAFNQFSEAIDNMSSMNIGSSEDLKNTAVQSCKNALFLYGYKILSYARKNTVMRKKLLDTFVNSLRIDNCELPEQIVYFDMVSTFLKDKFDITAKDALKVKYRSEARNDAGVTLSVNDPQGKQNLLRKSAAESGSIKKQRYLDVELVAMYW